MSITNAIFEDIFFFFISLRVSLFTYMRYWPNVISKRFDICQVLSFTFYWSRWSRGAKKNEAIIQLPWLNKPWSVKVRLYGQPCIARSGSHSKHRIWCLILPARWANNKIINISVCNNVLLNIYYCYDDDDDDVQLNSVLLVNRKNYFQRNF